MRPGVAPEDGVTRPDARLAHRDLVQPIFLAGLVLRVVVFAYMNPCNWDDHYGNIRYIFEHGRPPLSSVLTHSFHPPLYYLLSTPILWFGERKAVQAFSLLTSFATLGVMRELVRDRRLFRTALAANAAISLAAFLPSFVVFGLYVSNDSMSFLVGAAIFAAMRGARGPFTCKSTLLLAVLCGIGLLTKGTFLAFVPALALFVCTRSFRRYRRAGASVAATVAFLAVACGVGAYKFVENAVHFGRPIVHNLDGDSDLAVGQRPVYVGPSTIFDVDVFKLVREPTLSESTRHSYPLLLYGTFWYKYVDVENNFFGCLTGWRRIGSAIYLLAIPTTLAGLVGLLLALVRGIAGLRSAFRGAPDTGNSDSAESDFLLSAMVALLLSVALVVTAGVMFDAWSCFQSRLFFAAFFAVLLAVGIGFDRAASNPGLAQLLATSHTLLSGACVLYFSVEIALLA